MKDLLQKVSYLKGLSDGLNINKDKDEGRLLLETLDVLEELAFAIDDIVFRQDMLLEDMGEIDDDLLDLENYVYDLDSTSIKDFDGFDFDDLDDKYIDIFESFDQDDYDEDLLGDFETDIEIEVEEDTEDNE